MLLFEADVLQGWPLSVERAEGAKDKVSGLERLEPLVHSGSRFGRVLEGRRVFKCPNDEHLFGTMLGLRVGQLKFFCSPEMCLEIHPKDSPCLFNFVIKITMSH